jgi:succinate dehydrogenase / fumarate reductase, membrane anchor subunit
VRLLSGQRAFVAQRLAAIVLLAYVAAAALRLGLGAPVSFADWQAWSARPLGAALLLVLAVAVLVHAWVGARDVFLDYVPAGGARLAALSAAAVGLAGLGAWVLVIIVRHALSHPAI